MRRGVIYEGLFFDRDNTEILRKLERGRLAKSVGRPHCTFCFRPSAEDIPEEIAGYERERRDVRPEYRRIGKEHEPRAEKAGVIAEGLFGVCECSAGIGTEPHHVSVVDPDNGDKNGSDGHSERCSRCSRHGKEGSPGHDKSAPADNTAERQRPGSERRYMLNESV